MRRVVCAVMLAGASAHADPRAYVAGGVEAAIATYGKTVAGTVEAGVPFREYELLVLVGGGGAFDAGKAGSYLEVEAGGAFTKCTQSEVICFVGKLAFAYRAEHAGGSSDALMFDYAAGMELGGRDLRYRLIAAGGLGDLNQQSSRFVANGSLQLAVGKRF